MRDAVTPDDGVATRIAARTAARRTNYQRKVRALLDAALRVIVAREACVRVADVVAAAVCLTMRSTGTFRRRKR